MTKSHDITIDEVTKFVLDSLNIIGGVYPQVGAALPILRFFIKREAEKLKQGIATGSIVPDGHGGFVPATNSHYNPNTGEFL